MFQEPKFLQNSFVINFSRCMTIRRLANDFEDALKEKLPGHYSQPQVIPIPDELDPEVPRLIFTSTHGYSQIIISQISLIFNVVYSPDWQVDISKGERYLLERSKILFDLVNIIPDVQIYFCGLTTRARIPSQVEDEKLLDFLREKFLKTSTITKEAYDIQIKITKVIEKEFFSNIVIQNYRTWKIGEPLKELQRFSLNSASERGIEIIGDFNDRYAFNEKDSYYSQKEISEEIIQKGIEIVKETIHHIMEEL